MSPNDQETRLDTQNLGDGLMNTTIHGMQQDVYLITEDRVESFSTNSNEFQISLALLSASFGAAITSFTDKESIVFIISLITGLIFLVATIYTYVKYRRLKKKMFVKKMDALEGSS